MQHLFLLLFALLFCVGSACPKADHAPQNEAPQPKLEPQHPGIQWADIIEKIAHSDTAIEQIVTVRNGFYGPDGELFREMMLKALSTPEGREEFLAALQYNNCIKKLDAWHCMPSWTLVKEYWTNSPMYRFGETQLNRDIEELQETLESFGTPENNDFNWLTDEHWEPFFGYMLILEPHATELLGALLRDVTRSQIKHWLEFAAKALKHSKDWQLSKNAITLAPGSEERFKRLFKEFTGYSWNTLNEQEIREILKKLSAFLTENKGKIRQFLR